MILGLLGGSARRIACDVRSVPCFNASLLTDGCAKSIGRAVKVSARQIFGIWMHATDWCQASGNLYVTRDAIAARSSIL